MATAPNDARAARDFLGAFKYVIGVRFEPTNSKGILSEPLDIARHLNKLDIVVTGEGVPPLTAVLPFEIGRLMTPDKDSCLGSQCRRSPHQQFPLAKNPKIRA
jgi:hypothetical protein